MPKYWHEDIETMSREDMKKLQNERLVKQVHHVYEHAEPKNTGLKCPLRTSSISNS